jgi:DNA-directed RNA polymerase specialized sigma24 family protein
VFNRALEKIEEKENKPKSAEKRKKGLSKKDSNTEQRRMMNLPQFQKGAIVLVHTRQTSTESAAATVTTLGYCIWIKREH